MIIERFDQVKLLTTKNVKYLSHDPQLAIQPDGVWTVVTVVGGDLLLAKHGCVIRIPKTDVSLISKYDLSQLTRILGNLTNG